MNKFFLVKITVIIFIIAGLISGYFFIAKNKEDQKSLIPIEDWSVYEDIFTNDDKFIGSGDCSNEEFNELKAKVVLGEMKKFMYKDILELTFTPNYLSWSNDKFINFRKDNTAICAAGGRFPLHAYSDKLLWIGNCINKSSIDSVDFEIFNENCEMVKEEVNSYFNVN